MAGIADRFNGFVNTKIENLEIGSDVGTPEQVEISQQIDTHLLDAAGNKVSDSAIEGFVITHTLTFTGGKITQWVRDFDMVPIRKSRAAKAAKATDIISLSKATWEKQKTMALGDVRKDN